MLSSNAAGLELHAARCVRSPSVGWGTRSRLWERLVMVSQPGALSKLAVVEMYAGRRQCSSCVALEVARY